MRGSIPSNGTIRPTVINKSQSSSVMENTRTFGSGFLVFCARSNSRTVGRDKDESQRLLGGGFETERRVVHQPHHSA